MNYFFGNKLNIYIIPIEEIANLVINLQLNSSCIKKNIGKCQID